MSDLERRLTDGVTSGLDAERLVEKLGRRALDAGLADVAYGSMDSPVGELLVAVTDRGLLRVAFADEPGDEVLAELADRVSPRVLRLPARTDAARRELDEYFAGDRVRFDLQLDWSLVRGFAQGVLRATAKVPFGEVTTYRFLDGPAMALTVQPGDEYRRPPKEYGEVKAPENDGRFRERRYGR